ncbi:MAG: RNase adapter RapZ [Acidimicrobiia bacterium]
MGDVMTPQVLVLTGMSGAGRSTAAKMLEDLGFTVIDNLPPQLITGAVDHHGVTEGRRKLALVIDSRGGLPVDAIHDAIRGLEQQGIRTRLLFLDADDQSIIRRYEENRRPHPLQKGSLTEAIAAERALLEPLKDESDTVIDTTELNVHQFRERIDDQFSEGTQRPMRVSVTSFGFKHGTPRDIDLMFDVRFLPNPHWEPELRPYRGTDSQVADFVLASDDAQEFLSHVEGFLEFVIPRFEAEGKSYLTIGIGCTGGHHRSVALAEEIGTWLDERDIDARVRHRDIDK